MNAGVLVDVGQSLTSFGRELISIDLDVTLAEEHHWENLVTMNPVEFGSPITDHIQEQPDKLHITGFISDSAISDAAIKQINDIDGGQFETRVQTAFDVLRRLKTDRQLVTVFTRYKMYTDMAISSLTLPRGAGIGDSIEFDAEFVHVRLVETQAVNVPPGISRKADKKEGGKKGDTSKKTEPQAKAGDKAATTPPVNAATKAKTSIAASLFGGS